MLTFIINSNSKTPLYQQIYENFQERILNGVLSPGTKLPSSRNLATNLGISRNTVDTAYYQLQAEGYIDAVPKSGFYVCDTLPEEMYPSHPSIPIKINTVKAIRHRTQSDNKSFNGNQEPKYLYDFSPFAIDISHFPFSVWRKLYRQCLMDENELFLLGNNYGDMPLRQAICNYVCLSREVNCTPEQIIIGAGVDYLLQMLSLVFEQEGLTHITLENPGYMQAAHIFHNNGLTISSGELDEKGLLVSSISPMSQIVYVTPSHQFPLGTVMPFGRRKELLAWASSDSQHYIVEDDHDSEFRYKGKPIPSLQGMDINQKVIYIGTFSKAIAPAIRVGYMVLPPSLLNSYQKICGEYSCTVSRLDQAILTDFLDNGHFEKHVNRMRKIYRSKHDLLLNCLQPLAEKYHFKIHGANAGLHLIIELPQNGISEEELIERAKKEGIRLYGIKEHYLPENSSTKGNVMSGVLLGYSNLSEEEIEKGICRMADAGVFCNFR